MKTIAEDTTEIKLAADKALQPIPAELRTQFRPLEQDDVRNVRRGETLIESYWQRVLMDTIGMFSLNFNKRILVN